MFELLPALSLYPVLDLNLARIIVMGKVVAALGMILLALEDQLAINHAAQERERRARLELEAYTNLILSRRRVEDFDRQANEICQTVAKHSRFAQAALLLRECGPFSPGRCSRPWARPRLTALDALATRIPGEGFSGPRLSAAGRGAQPDPATRPGSVAGSGR